MFRDEVIEHYRVRGYRIHERVKVRGRSGAVHACELVVQGPLGNLIVSFGDESGIEGPELAALKRTGKDVGAGAVVAVRDPGHKIREAARVHGVTVLDATTISSFEPMTVEEQRPEAEDHPWPEQESRLRQAARRHDEEPAPTTIWKHPRGGKGEGDERFGWLKGAASDAEPRGAASVRMTSKEPEPQRQAPARLVERPPSTSHAETWDPPHERVDAVLRGHDRQRAEADPTQAPRTRRTDAAEAVETAPLRAPVFHAAPARPGFPWRWVWAPVLFGVAAGATLFLLLLLF